MIDTQAIRKKILDLALRGKLTEQRPEDGKAEKLYRQILDEKHTLEQAGKIKKSKSLPPVTADEVSYEVPSCWQWVRFGNIITLLSGQDLKPEEYGQMEVGIPYLTGASNFDQYGVLVINRWTDSPKNIARKGDIILSCKGTVGKTAILTAECVHIARQFMAITTYCVDVNYIVSFIKSKVDELKAASKGLIPGIERNDVLNLPVPLPPLPEQHRIVAKIDAIFSLLDTIDALQSTYNANQKTLRAKLIDAAIRGQLTEQLPEDGTAEELYQQIQAEKAALEKAGKIKKSKPLPPVAEEEKPFEIPESWKWVRFFDLMLTISTGPFGSMLHKSDYVNNGIPLVNPMNIVGGRIIPSDKMMVSEESRLRLASYVLHEGMIVMGRRGEMGRCAIVNQNENGWLCGTGSFFMEPSNCILVQYVIVLLSTIYAKTYLGGQSIGMTMSNLNHTILTKMPIPLPPLAEQKRIIAKLEVLLAVCEG